MSAHKEIEMKLRFFDDTLWDEITKEPSIVKMSVNGSEKIESLETIYYDTPAFSLKKAGLSYRIRLQGSEYVATVKADGITSGGLHNRSEWSCVMDAPKTDIKPFLALPVGERIKDAVGEQGLNELFRTRFKRKSVILRTKDKGLIELAIDLGKVIAKEKEAPIQEIELELKDGKIAEVLRLAALLVRRFILLPESQSKYYRGIVLANLTPIEEKETTAGIKIDPEDKAAVALEKAILFALQEVISAQENTIKNKCDFRSVNQFKDKLKKLITVLKFSESFLTDKEINPIFLELVDSGQHNIIENITKAIYLAPIYELWAWLLENNWPANAYIKTIGEHAQEWLVPNLFDGRSTVQDILTELAKKQIGFK